jgi:protein phosphatase 1G
LIFLHCKQGPHSDFDGPTSGSTACVAIIRNNLLFVANAGDSRCVISRNGQVTSKWKTSKWKLLEFYHFNVLEICFGVFIL